MAHGYLQYFGGGRVAVCSAGVEVHGVNPKAVAVMQEDGIDISHHTSNDITEYQQVEFDYVITVCDHANERCPFFSGKAKRLHYNFPDPAKMAGTESEVVSEFIRVRELIKEFCSAFIRENID